MFYYFSFLFLLLFLLPLLPSWPLGGSNEVWLVAFTLNPTFLFLLLILLILEILSPASPSQLLFLFLSPIASPPKLASRWE